MTDLSNDTWKARTLQWIVITVLLYSALVTQAVHTRDWVTVSFWAFGLLHAVGTYFYYKYQA